MAPRVTAVAVALVLVTSLFFSARASTDQSHSLAMDWIPTKSACKGTLAECLSGEEFAFDSEVSRRVLAVGGYISYGALRRNTVPCSVRGASYYNCRPSGAARPYQRGCSAIARCRS